MPKKITWDLENPSKTIVIQFEDDATDKETEARMREEIDDFLSSRSWHPQ